MTYLTPTAEEIKKVRDVYKVTDESIKRDAEIVQMWIKQQKHLPQNVTDDWFIELFIIRNKLMVERVKTKIDAYYSSKTLYKKYFENNEHILPSNRPIFYILGRLTPALERISYFKAFIPVPSSFDLAEEVKYFVMTNELEMNYDYLVSKILIVDYQNMTFDMFKKMDLHALRDYIKMWNGPYSERLKAIHFINVPIYINFVLGLAKPILSSKLYSRIHLHENLESLYKVVPKEDLVSDFGGEDKSIKEYTNLMDQIFENHRSFYKQLPTLCTNEQLRVGKIKDCDNLGVFGTDGTFKKINLD